MLPKSYRRNNKIIKNQQQKKKLCISCITNYISRNQVIFIFKNVALACFLFLKLPKIKFIFQYIKIGHFPVVNIVDNVHMLM